MEVADDAYDSGVDALDLVLLVLVLGVLVQRPQNMLVNKITHRRMGAGHNEWSGGCWPASFV